jgi:hypothetical protein
MNGSQDFPYWESDRTQPNGQTVSNAGLNEVPVQYLQQQQPVHPPQPQPQAISLPGKDVTVTITTSAVKLDIIITPL